MKRYSRLWWMSLLLSSVVTGSVAFLVLLNLTDWSIPKLVVASGILMLIGDLTLALTMEKVAPTKIAVGPGERYLHTDRSSDKAIVLSGFGGSPTGQVSVRGETWQAVRAPGDEGNLSEGTIVHVVERISLTLVVSASDTATPEKNGGRAVSKFQAWWQRPIRTKDRVSAALVGLLGGFWIGLLGRAFAATDPVATSTVLLWGAAVGVACAVLATIYPKHATIVLFPFSVFGVGN